jgi:hypothetical protein
VRPPGDDLFGAVLDILTCTFHVFAKTVGGGAAADDEGETGGEEKQNKCLFEGGFHSFYFLG